MAVKKKGLGKGLDSLIPDNRGAKTAEPELPSEKEYTDWRGCQITIYAPFYR